MSLHSQCLSVSIPSPIYNGIWDVCAAAWSALMPATRNEIGVGNKA